VGYVGLGRQTRLSDGQARGLISLGQPLHFIGAKAGQFRRVVGLLDRQQHLHLSTVAQTALQASHQARLGTNQSA
jgi:hypothetical protein